MKEVSLLDTSFDESVVHKEKGKKNGIEDMNDMNRNDKDGDDIMTDKEKLLSASLLPSPQATLHGTQFVNTNTTGAQFVNTTSTNRVTNGVLNTTTGVDNGSTAHTSTGPSPRVPLLILPNAPFTSRPPLTDLSLRSSLPLLGSSSILSARLVPSPCIDDEYKAHAMRILNQDGQGHHHSGHQHHDRHHHKEERGGHHDKVICLPDPSLDGQVTANHVCEPKIKFKSVSLRQMNRRVAMLIPMTDRRHTAKTAARQIVEGRGRGRELPFSSRILALHKRGVLDEELVGYTPRQGGGSGLD